MKSGEDHGLVFPGFSRFAYLPLEISESYTPRNYNGYRRTMDILHVVHSFFLITCGNSTHFLIYSWKFHIFSFFPRGNSMFSTLMFFSEIAHCLVSILCEHGKERR